MAHPRLLRVGQPQRQGDLPALHGLVRRQPGPPVAAPAARRSPSATSTCMGGVDARRRARAGRVRRRRLPLGGDAARPRGLRRRRPRRGAARCTPTPSSSSATAPRTAPGATSTSRARPSCARATSARRPSTNAPRILAQLTPEQLFDAIAIRVDGPKAWDLDLAFDVTLHRPRAQLPPVTLGNGVLVYVEREPDASTPLAAHADQAAPDPARGW